MMTSPLADPKMPFLANVLHTAQATAQLREATGEPLTVTAARLIRHKPGRRFLIEYDVETARERLTLIGKARAKGLDRATYALQAELAAGAFASGAPDGVEVPPVAGVVPAWHMALQRKVDGRPVTSLLGTP